MTTPAQPSSTRPADDAPPFRYTARLADSIETRWQSFWDEQGVFKQPNPGEPGFDASRPKFYCLDMFPYPSGAGLHVGHPEGYTATDILSRFMRMKGRNVLHPMGWDAFGLPAEQYAIQTGIHPAKTTKASIDTFRRQLKRFGFSYDWSREVGTIDEDYYRWTQWIFLKLYNSWFDPQAESPAYPDGKTRRGCARPIADLIRQLEGGDLRVGLDGELLHIGVAATNPFLGAEPVGTRRWHELSRTEQRAVIDSQRLAYLDEMTVNWCPMLGTVLANDEVIDGKSERGGHPVLRKPLKQWQFRITAYADRLLSDLDLLDWPHATKVMQSEWIGKSEGAEIDFALGSPPLRGGAFASVAEAAERLKQSPRGAVRPADFEPRDPFPAGEQGLSASAVVEQRYMPHIRMPGATYFATWKTLGDRRLSDEEQTIVTDALRHFDSTRCKVFAYVVMSNHVHWLVRPYDDVEMSDLLASVKRFSATAINKLRGESGHVWDPEAFDHIVRDLGYFNEFLSYIINNPVSAGVVSRPADYRWTFVHPDILSETEDTASERRATQTIRVFTTRPDTLFGATYMVIAPEHELVEHILAHPAQETDAAALGAYVAKARNTSDVDRMAGADKAKTGVFTGVYCINPANGHRIPVWTADYVLTGYGTGAIMAVPAHDERDHAFAKKFNLPIVEVIRGDKAFDVQESAYTGPGKAVNSFGTDLSINGMSSDEAKSAVIAWLEKSGQGMRKVNYRLRDWVFSRQRYWGEPIPIVFDEHGDHFPVSESALPVALPVLADYTPVPSDEPQPLLAKATDWMNTTAQTAGVSPDVLPPETRVRRETNTMPGSAGSSWYFLRYCDPKNAERPIAREVDRYWMAGFGTPPLQGGSSLDAEDAHSTASEKRATQIGGVDLYIGGSEHAVGHLLYSRFWQKALFDLGEVSTPEPFQKLFHQGMITSFAYQRPDKSIVPMDEVREQPDGSFVEATTGVKLSPIVTKMSKRYKNVINPDDIIAEFGADTFRLYEMYMGPLDASKPWNTKDTVGCYRFLQRAWRLVIDETTGHLKLLDQPNPDVDRQLHKTIAKVDADVPRLAFNTAIAAMMEFVNAATSAGGLTRAQLELFALTLAPFTPHIAEELWHKLGHARSIALESFPGFDPALVQDATIEIPVQIAGKVKAKIMVDPKLDKAALEAAALADAQVRKLIEGKTVQKIIAVPGKLVNIVAT